MLSRTTVSMIAAVFIATPMLATVAHADGVSDDLGQEHLVNTHRKNGKNHAQLGPRPFYLVEKMGKGTLKTALQECSDGPFYKTDFSIGHRGAALQFPEHTKESYQAAARMGAGILECDVTFTKDLALVCRHSQCDLHTTTDILVTPLAEKCSVPFSPAEFDPDTGALTKAASAQCCTSDITLDEFKTLCGKMDASNPNATTAAEFLGGTASFRTDLYATCGTLLTHAESIELFKELDTKMTPELKVPSVPMPFNGFSQDDYRQKLIDEYKAAQVNPHMVYAQSFNPDDVRYWIEHEPQFGKQAVYLDDRYETLPGFDPNVPSTWVPSMEEIVTDGVKIIAPPMWVLLTVENSKIVPSKYAKAAKAAGLDIITWTTERSGRIVEDVLIGGDTFYYQSTLDAISNDGDILVTLDVLAKDVGILGIFSDWPATVTYYANCMHL
ncbi:MAG: glycerophosphodiester phosphodiesterase family protein [Gammaproteobacteria bacterium]